jgi:hypothetical protein
MPVQALFIVKRNGGLTLLLLAKSRQEFLSGPKLYPRSHYRPVRVRRLLLPEHPNQEVTV